LQAETLGAQQVSDGVRADPMALAGQLAGQHPRRLRRPPQRRHRVAPLLGLDQGQQRRPQAGVEIDGALASAADPADPTQRLGPRLQLVNTRRHGRLPHSRSPGDQPNPAMPQRPRLSTHQQPPLPLVEMREDRLKLRRQRFLAHSEPHSTRLCRNHGTYGLFSGNP
jgi:hypothetical protein